MGKETWPEGYNSMQEVAIAHYQMTDKVVPLSVTAGSPGSDTSVAKQTELNHTIDQIERMIQVEKRTAKKSETAEQARFHSLEARVQTIQEDVAEMKQYMRAIADACGGVMQ